jgi:phosphatidylglycerol:prolipoprotein diacylglycerol transferase
MYGIILAIYFCLALPLVATLNRKQGVATDITLTAFAIGVPAGIVGARLLDILEYPSRYTSFAELLGRHGSSIYGAFFLNGLVTWVYLSRLGVSPLAFLDAGAPALALGEAMSRIGCFLNGCCYGVSSSGPFAVTFPRASFAFQDQVARGLLASSALRSLPVHPVQLYSSAAMFATTFYLWKRFTSPHRTGDVFWQFLIFYGVLRLGVAPIRVEVLPTMVTFSLLFVMVGTVRLCSSRAQVRACSAGADAYR